MYSPDEKASVWKTRFHAIASATQLARALAAAAAFILLLGVLAGTALAEADLSRPADFPFEWYQQPAENQPGKAYLELTPSVSPVKLIEFPDSPAGYVWNISFSLRERNDISFTITRFTETFFNSEHSVTFTRAHVGPECANFFGSETLPGGVLTTYNVFRGVCGDVGYAACFEIVDEFGCELAFGVYIPLSQEVEERVTPELFRQSAPREEGHAYVIVSPAEDPFVLVEDSHFDGGKGWFVAFLYENVGDSAFYPSSLLWALFDGEQLVDCRSYDVELFGEVLPDGKLVKDGPKVDTPFGVRLQSVTHVGMQITGTDETGAELSFAALVPLAQE